MKKYLKPSEKITYCRADKKGSGCRTTTDGPVQTVFHVCEQSLAK